MTEMSPSEVAAALLYGPAPEGDEDPHASQTVPDPGETSGPPIFATQDVLDSLSPGIKIMDVDGDHWVKLESGDWQLHKDGRTLRSKTLATLWAPFTVVGMEEA